MRHVIKSLIVKSIKRDQKASKNFEWSKGKFEISELLRLLAWKGGLEKACCPVECTTELHGWSRNVLERECLTNSDSLTFDDKYVE